MEVHAHTHSPRKKWTHYFWEFLMLFLAVFCGFLAENQREHIVEAHRAKEYAKGMLNDLKQDTADLHQAINETGFLVTAFDSVIAIGSRNKSKTDVPGTFYYYGRFTSNTYQIDWNRSTITQLVQSGNLRYIKDKGLVNKINSYYALQELISGKNMTDWDHRSKVMETRNRILDPRYYPLFVSLDLSDATAGHKPSGQIESLMAQRLSLQEGADKLMGGFLNDLIDRSWRNKSYFRNDYPKAIKIAEEIIHLLSSQYHLN